MSSLREFLAWLTGVLVMVGGGFTHALGIAPVLDFVVGVSGLLSTILIIGGSELIGGVLGSQLAIAGVLLVVGSAVVKLIERLNNRLNN